MFDTDAEIDALIRKEQAKGYMLRIEITDELREVVRAKLFGGIDEFSQKVRAIAKAGRL